MKIYVFDKVLEYSNSQTEIDKLFNEIDSIVLDSKYTFSHLEIDGVEIYDDFYGYFLDNIRNIKEVKVIAKTFKEFSREILNTTAEYLENAIPEIQILSDEFYKSPTEESWRRLADLIEGIKWIMDTFVIVDKSGEIENIVKDYEVWNQYAKDIYSLRELLDDFEDILENEDLVSIGDILSYEIELLFKEILNKLNKLVDREANSSDFS
ncbi:hypothetical protein [Sporanaerobacter acetigenes]|uniref:hypothetical protein n=1 Tax=Sporanaerobacter acetigenes TaxID=165813 RepID=UPI00331D2722